MRVANIIEEARIGGPQIRNLKVAKVLKENIEVTLVFPEENSKAIKKQCNLLGVNYLSLSLTTINRSMFGILVYLILFPFEVLMLARLFKKHKFDLVHVSGGCWQSKGIFAAKLARIKVIWELNDTNSPSIVRKIFFFLSRLANGFIFASERTKKYYKKFIPNKKKNFVIQSPVDVNLFNPNLDFPIDKSIRKIIKKKIIVGTVTNINPIKDLERFISVAQKLSIYSNKVIFIVVGHIYTSQKEYYNNLILKIKHLKLRNFLFMNAREDVRSLLKSMDIYVCTSKNESSPLSVWEAMSMERAIVSKDVGDVSKFINNGVNGFIIKASNTDSLAESVKKLILNPKLRKKFGKKSRQIAKNKLDLNECGKLHSIAYKSISSYN
jgi:glycosyltransferase involved in cell wall biosynthesis